MLKECLEVFASMLEKSNGKLVLDTYIPADGTYIIVGRDGEIKVCRDIIKDRVTKEIERDQYTDKICFYDYQSQLISMNKPIDPKKVIHSNNYLSFFIKKENLASGKLTEDIIDKYYDVLKNPVEEKYKKSKEATEIYELYQKMAGEADQDQIEKKRKWIKEHIFCLRDVDLSRKDYLKIFFEADEADYEREGQRYFLPNIYNNNDYNVKINEKVYGIPDNNLGMNSKKPFLSIKSRKLAQAYMLDEKEVILQKQFFDYLMNLVSAGKYHIYVDTQKKVIEAYGNKEAPDSIETGFYFRIRKGKSEAEIYEQDNIASYSQRLDPAFVFRNIVGVDHEKYKHPEFEEEYHFYGKRIEVESLIDKVFFFRYLVANYLLERDKLDIKNGTLKESILLSRDAVFDWARKGENGEIYKVLQRTSFSMIKDALKSGNKEHALRQFNLRWSLKEYFKGGEDMGEIITELKEKVERKVLLGEGAQIEDDREYFYCAGQLVGYLISLSKAKDANQALLNPFLNMKTDEEMKKRILQLYKKYNYMISNKNLREKRLMAMILGYVPEEKKGVDQEMFLLGYACDSVIYKNSSEI